MLGMSFTRPRTWSATDSDLELDRLCRRLGAAIRTSRQAHGWSTQQVAHAAGLSRSAVTRLESGKAGGLVTYQRIADVLGLRLTWELTSLATTLEAEDAVHAVMGEVQARRFATGTRRVLVDEPYQHFRFAGRGDLVVVDRGAAAIHHSENKTRIVNVGELSGSFNAKCRWLSGDVAERNGIRRIRSETHTLVLLWSEEVLAVARSLGRTLRALGPDGADPFGAWWDGSPLAGVHRGLVVFDPIDRGTSQPQWVSLEDALDARPRYRGYADAFHELRAAGLA
jgi:transcriptional regulator with XRE-family HTH domain